MLSKEFLSAMLDAGHEFMVLSADWLVLGMIHRPNHEEV